MGQKRNSTNIIYDDCGNQKSCFHFEVCEYEFNCSFVPDTTNTANSILTSIKENTSNIRRNIEFIKIQPFFVWCYEFFAYFHNILCM